MFIHCIAETSQASNETVIEVQPKDHDDAETDDLSGSNKKATNAVGGMPKVDGKSA